MLSERRDKHAARRFLRRLVEITERKPARITTDRRSPASAARSRVTDGRSWSLDHRPQGLASHDAVPQQLHRAESPSGEAALLPDAGTVADAAAVTPEDVYRYLGGFSHLSLETRHRYFREVRCFFNWLVDARHLQDNPFRGIKNVRLPQRIVEPFSPADIAQLMAGCDSATALGLRDRAMVLCLLDTGLRCSELVQLTLR